MLIKITDIKKEQLHQIFILLFIWLVSFFYMSIVIKPFLYYQLQQPSFLTTNSFFESFLSYPGDISKYITLFVSQFFYYNLFGSAIISTFIIALVVLTYLILHRLFGVVHYGFLTITLQSIFALALVSNYYFPFSVIISSLIIIFFSYLFLIAHFKNYWFSITIYFILSLISYHVCGGGYFIGFSGLSLIVLAFNYRKKEDWVLFLAILLYCALMPYFMQKWFYLITFQEAYFYIFANVPAMLNYIPSKYLWVFYGYLPAMVFLQYYIHKLVKSKKPQIGKNVKQPVNNKAKNVKIIFGAQFLIPVLAGFFILKANIKSETKAILLVDYYAENRSWDKLLSTVNQTNEYSLLNNYYFNYATYHNGNLLDNLFYFPQYRGSQSLYLDNKIYSETVWALADLYFDLGLVTNAQHFAYEAQTKMYYSPRVLKKLVLVNLINRNYLVAADLLYVMQQNILTKSWASKYTSYLKDTAKLNQDELISEKRKKQLHSNFIIKDLENNLISILDQDSENRMAFEYLMAFYILNADFTGFSRNLSRMEKIKYERIPKVFQQVAAMFRSISKKETDDPIFKIPIDKAIMNDYANFENILINCKDNLGGSQGNFKEYRNTFWYYLIFEKPQNQKSIQP